MIRFNFIMPGQFKKPRNTILSNNYIGDNYFLKHGTQEVPLKKKKVICNSSFSVMYMPIPTKKKRC